MSERGKKKQFEGKGEPSENEESSSVTAENKSEISFNKNSTKYDFIETLKQSLKDLWYISETDAEINVFLGEKSDFVTKEALAEQLKLSSGINIEERDFTDFFRNLTEIQDWYGDEEKETAEKFSTVKKLLEENLTDLKVFKVGQIEIDIYVVGLDSQSILTGIKTQAVET